MRLHVWLAAAAVGLGPSPAVRAAPPEVAPLPRPFDVAAATAAMVAEFDRLERTFHDELRAANHNRGQILAANAQYQNAHAEWAGRAVAFILRYPDSPATFGLIGKYLDRADVRTDELATVIRKHHLAHPLLTRVFPDLTRSEYEPARKLVTDLADTHPDRTVRGQAAFAIGEAAKSKLMYAGKYGSRPLTADQKDTLHQQADRYLTRVVNDYADVLPVGGDRSLGKQATAQLAGLRNLDLLVVGKVAPDIAGEDIDGRPFKLSDYRGKVVLLDFWGDW